MTRSSLLQFGHAARSLDLRQTHLRDVGVARIGEGLNDAFQVEDGLLRLSLFEPALGERQIHLA